MMEGGLISYTGERSYILWEMNGRGAYRIFALRSEYT